MTQTREVTLEDISNAIRLIQEEYNPINYKFDWGEITTDVLGNPLTIKFKRNQLKGVKELIKKNFTKKEGKVATIFGIKVLNTINLKN